MKYYSYHSFGTFNSMLLMMLIVGLIGSAFTNMSFGDSVACFFFWNVCQIREVR